MNHQKRDPYPTNDKWWSEKVFWGVSRNTLALVLICLVLAIVLGDMDWDHVFGRRDHIAAHK